MPCVRPSRINAPTDDAAFGAGWTPALVGKNKTAASKTRPLLKAPPF